MPLFFWFDPFLGDRMKIKKVFCLFFGHESLLSKFTDLSKKVRVQHRKLSLKIERLVDQQVDTLEFKCLCPLIPHCTMGQNLNWSCTWIFTKKKNLNFNLQFNKERMTLSSDTIIVWNIQKIFPNCSPSPYFMIYHC